MKCPVHGTEMVKGRCVMCGMTEEQVKARLAGSTNPPKETAIVQNEETAKPQVPTPQLTKDDLIEARFQARELRLAQADNQIKTLHSTVHTMLRTVDRLSTHVEGMIRAVDALQSLALVNSAEFAGIERVLGYMNAEREFAARALGIKSMAEIKESLEAFHREREEKAAPSPSGPIAPEDAPTKQEHDETAPNAA